LDWDELLKRVFFYKIMKGKRPGCCLLTGGDQGMSLNKSIGTICRNGLRKQESKIFIGGIGVYAETAMERQNAALTCKTCPV
jgi:hypothetical protein